MQPAGSDISSFSLLFHAFFLLSNPASAITLNSAWPQSVGLEIWVCVVQAAANIASSSQPQAVRRRQVQRSGYSPLWSIKLVGFHLWLEPPDYDKGGKEEEEVLGGFLSEEETEVITVLREMKGLDMNQSINSQLGSIELRQSLKLCIMVCEGTSDLWILSLPHSSAWYLLLVD